MAIEQFRFLCINQFIVDSHIEHGLIDTLAIVRQDLKRAFVVHHGLCLDTDGIYLILTAKDRHTAVTLGITQQFIVEDDTLCIVFQLSLYLPIGFVSQWPRIRVHVEFAFLILQPVIL